MSEQDFQQPFDTPDEPAMELMGGDATDATPATSSLLSRVVRGTVYGTMILAGTALLAVSAVPDLARYAAFIPDGTKSTSTCSASRGGCSALNAADLYCDKYGPSESDEQAVALSSEGCGGCPLSQAALMTEGGSCCSASQGACGAATKTVAATPVCSEETGCAAGLPCCQETLADETTTTEDQTLVKAETQQGAAVKVADDENNGDEPAEN